MSDHPAHHLAAQSDEVSSLPPDAWTGSAAGPDTSDVWPHRAPARREEVPMGVFERMAEHGHEQVVFCYDRTTGMKAIIAIHNTTLGHALGSPDLRGRRVAVQGLGGVGAHLAQLLVQGGASVTGADADAARAKEVADQLGIAL